MSKNISIKEIKKNNKFNYNIDHINYNPSMKVVEIHGWIYHQDNIQISCKGDNIIEQKKINRPDVMEYLNISKINCGFYIKLNKTNSLRPILIEFQTSEDVLVLKITLNSLTKIFKISNLKDFYLYYKKNGLKNAILHSYNILNWKVRNGDSVISLEQQYEKYIENEKKVYNDFKKLDYNPLISILVPVYNVPDIYLKQCIESVINQTYINWELCLVDDCSTKEHVRTTLNYYANMDSRIKVKFREKNGHISVASNDALELATGEYIALLDNDDELAVNALEEVVLLLNNKNYDFIYTDEDKIDENGKRMNPHFKPDWSPDTLMSINYICHFAVIRKSLINEIGGFTKGLEGAQDYDLFLRVTEKTTSIGHIPKILYHWRILETSTAKSIDSKDYTQDASIVALKNAINRRGYEGDIKLVNNAFSVNYKPKKNSKISIIIPTKDHADILETCLKSIYQKTTYSNFEVIVVNNNSCESRTFKLLDKYKIKYNNFFVMDNNIPFNYSKLNNDALTVATGEYILLLNNDIEIITSNWLEIMLGYAQLPHVGAVGAKLLYPDNTVQHCGVVLGIGGVAGHLQKNANKNDLGYFWRLAIPYNYGAVTAACLLVERKKYEEVGGLEEKLQVAFNDVDFNIRLLEKGYYNVVLPQVLMYHHESKSRGHENTAEKIKRFNSEIEYMQKHWNPILQKDPFYNINLDLETESVNIDLK